MTAMSHLGTPNRPNRQVAPFGSWSSAISSEALATASVALSDLTVAGETIYWLETRPHQNGRQVIMASDGRSVAELTPEGFNVRSRVHEIGGAPYIVANGTVYFVNATDQRLYAQGPTQAPVPLTPVGYRYADFAAIGQKFICVREDHTDPANIRNAIVTVSATEAGAGDILFADSDFASCPRVSKDGRRLAWVAWDHPAMPWDSTTLYVADLDEGLSNIAVVAGGPTVSAIEPQWTDNDDLLYISDLGGFWNLYAWRDGASAPLAPQDAEFSRPPWWLGQSNYAQLGAGRILARYAEGGFDRLLVIDEGIGTSLPCPFVECHTIRPVGDDRAAFIGYSVCEAPAIVMLDVVNGKSRIVHRPSPLPLDPATVAVAMPVTFSTEGGKVAHALYYPPRNPAFQGPHAEKPPLIVSLHGGPSLQASPAFNLSHQYWTTRGYAVLDVNYGGSTGYGRIYRERLNGAWGVVEIEDAVAAATFLIERGDVDPGRVIIRGASAGGFATLGALSRATLFAAGSCHYGISNLEILLRETHKFQSRYLLTLLGPYPEERAKYVDRSPISHLAGFNAPLIMFQGSEDLITPPNQARMIRDALVGRGKPVAYLEFEGEGHGFRRAETIVRILNAEQYFFGKVFGFLPADAPEPIAVENLP